MNRDNFKELLQQKILVLDGGYGSEFFKRGYGGIPGDLLNLKHPDVVLDLQKSYVNAGCDILLANTFNANPMKLRKLGLEKDFEAINYSAVQIAKKASGAKTLVFGDFSSTGDFLLPIGKNEFDQVVHNYSQQTEILVDAEVDGFIIETMSDLKELKAAVLGIRAVNTDLPLIVQMSFEADGRTVTGTTPRIFASLMNDLDVDVIGVNCSTGPQDMLTVVKTIYENTTKFISVEPNAGIPQYDGKKVTYKMTPEQFANYAQEFAESGANIIGGCCGTTAQHIKAIAQTVRNIKPRNRNQQIKQVLSSRTEIFEPQPFLVIGERINPASKPKWQNEISDKDFQSLLKESVKQKEEGSSILDINLGIEKMLDEDHFKSVIRQLDKQSSIPLSLDIQTNKFLKVAMREYAGRPLLNSARVTAKSIERKAKLLNENGGMLILLAMGKRIPKTSEDRVKLILEGINELEAKGINRARIFVDALVLSYGAGNDPKVTMSTIEKLSEHGIKSVIGLSNLSFGMPGRSLLNGAFLAQAVGKGLSAAIMNSGDEFVMNSLHGSLSLTGHSYSLKSSELVEDPILNAIISGEQNDLQKQCESLLKLHEPLYVSQQILGKAMEEVGSLFSRGKIYLPQLLLAAETVQPIFTFINEKFPNQQVSKGKILLATVEGDIHDIGKQIIGTVLKSNGFDVIDIGQDIPATEIVKQVELHKPDILGLSAMMTTTVDEIGKVRNLLTKNNSNVILIAGGASMNEKLADHYNIDSYCKSAAQVVEMCGSLINEMIKSR